MRKFQNKFSSLCICIFRAGGNGYWAVNHAGPQKFYKHDLSYSYVCLKTSGTLDWFVQTFSAHIIPNNFNLQKV